MDVDGTLTDGKIYMGAKGEAIKAFNIKDGFGIHDIIPSNGITPVIITGRKSSIVEQRCEELCINDLFQGVKDKISVLKNYLEENRAQLSEVAYIGDDLNDLPCMILVKSAGGIIGCPADAAEEVKKTSDFVSQFVGGNGAVREFIEVICK